MAASAVSGAFGSRSEESVGRTAFSSACCFLHGVHSLLICVAVIGLDNRGLSVRGDGWRFPAAYSAKVQAEGVKVPEVLHLDPLPLVVSCEVSGVAGGEGQEDPPWHFPRWEVCRISGRSDLLMPPCPWGESGE